MNEENLHLHIITSETNRAGPCDRCIVRQKDRCSLIEEFLQTEIVYNDHLVSLREVS